MRWGGGGGYTEISQRAPGGGRVRSFRRLRGREEGGVCLVSAWIMMADEVLAEWGGR